MENIIYISLAVILLVIIVILIKYNTLIQLQNRVKKAKANIDVYLNKRFDLIPNIVETVKGYTKHESSTLEDIVKLRNTYNSKESLDLNEANELNNKLNKYMLVLEAYPELKANSQFLALQSELSRIEDDLEYARRDYNDDVTRYNTAIEKVPSNIVASIFAFKKAKLFRIDDEAKKNVKVEL